MLFRLYRSKQARRREGAKYLTKPLLMVQMLTVLCNHRKDQHFHLIADAAYWGKSVLCHLPENGERTSRLHLDARLYDAPPARQTGQRGRATMPWPTSSKR